MCMGQVSRTVTTSDSERYFSEGEREVVQRVCSVCYDVWERNLGYESRGYAAASGESREDDDEVDVWSNVEGWKNE